MTSLDRLLETLSREPFEALLLVPGQPPVVRRAGQDQPASRTSVAGDSVLRLVEEVAPDDLDLEAASWSFERQVGACRYRIDGRPGSDGPRVRVLTLPQPPPGPTRLIARGAPPGDGGLAGGGLLASVGAPKSNALASNGDLLVDDRALAGNAALASNGAIASNGAVASKGAMASNGAPAGDGRPVSNGGPAGWEIPAWQQLAAGSDVPGIAGAAAGTGVAIASPAVPAAAQSEGPGPVRPEDAHRFTRLEPLLVELLERGGSDLHLTTGEPPRVRIDGELEILAGHDAPSLDELRAMLEPLTPPKNREEFADRHDTDFGFTLPGRARFRANLFRDHGGIGAVFRQIPASIPSAEDLRLPPAVAELSDLSRGLVLVTGPTGSGKSTTLAAIIDRANRTRSDHIITIEDPVEFVHPSKRCLVHQREVGTHTLSFAAALRAALREDPDIVLVGEMRDLETTRVAIETAETGHLVFGTLHTTSAAATVERLINQYPEGEQAQIRLMLAGTLKAVVAQTLLRKIGGGRVAAYEVLLITPAMSNLIREGKVFQIPSLMQTGRALGMGLLDESLLNLVKDELVTAEEAYKKANDKKELLGRFRSAGVRWESAEEPGAEADAPALRRVG